MPRYERFSPVWALSFGAILPHLNWCVHAVAASCRWREKEGARRWRAEAQVSVMPYFIGLLAWWAKSLSQIDRFSTAS